MKEEEESDDEDEKTKKSNASNEKSSQAKTNGSTTSSSTSPSMITSQNINSEHYKMNSKASTNASISIKSTRGMSNTYFSSEVDRLKTEVRYLSY